MTAVIPQRLECVDFPGDSPYRTISSYAWSNLGARISHAALEETERLLSSAGPRGEARRLD